MYKSTYIQAHIHRSREAKKEKEYNQFNLTESTWHTVQRNEVLLIIIIGFLILNLSEYSFSDFH